MPGAAYCQRTPSTLNSTKEGKTESLLSSATAFSKDVAPAGGAEGSAIAKRQRTFLRSNNTYFWLFLRCSGFTSSTAQRSNHLYSPSIRVLPILIACAATSQARQGSFRKNCMPTARRHMHAIITRLLTRPTCPERSIIDAPHPQGGTAPCFLK